MAIRIVPHGEEHRSNVDAFNQRLSSQGGELGFYVEPVPDWIPPQPGARVWREYHVAVDETGAVRGAYALKPQEWLINGQLQTVADWQGPVSEGQVDPRYGPLALRMMRQMTKQRPLLYSFGHGGAEVRIVQLVREMGWAAHPVPFCLKVFRPTAFLRKNRQLRTTRARALALDALALSGLGSIGVRALQLALRLRSLRRFGYSYSVEPSFGPWADELWNLHRHRYGALAVRDAAMLNRLFPPGDWPPVERLRVKRDDKTIGWAAVLHRQMKDEPRFGDLHVGNITDCFAAPENAGSVIAAALEHLQRHSVDLVYANFSHPAWIKAMADNGCVVVPAKRMFVTAPGLAEALQSTLAPTPSYNRASHGGLPIHLTNIDGHGPQDFR